ncbi:hypothetical protein GQ53DRAFT_752553 [Thozetella sp. PMI_491]|nr:hypothetical protein GQ53DRAFT_752553 [Thozetella sp. PMI_491]
MRGKRSKQYRKLMNEYQLGGGFREPYQVLLTADMVVETMKVDLAKYLEITFQGRVKPMITTCSMRAMYANNKDPTIAAAIERAKGFERRRCGHLMDQPAEPERDCVLSVVDGKGTGKNANHLCIASQDDDLRRRLRVIPFVPMCYSKRSVMILEPASAATLQAREQDEKAKFRDGLKSKKRKRENGGSDDEDGQAKVAQPNVVEPEEHEIKRKKRARGPKGPNPLSMKKAKAKARPEDQGKKAPEEAKLEEAKPEEPVHVKAKRKRRKKQKGGGETGADDSTAQAAVASAGSGEEID